MNLIKGSLGKAVVSASIIAITAVLLFSVVCIPVSAQIPGTVRVGIVTSNAASQYRNAESVTVSIKGDYKLTDLSDVLGEDLITSLKSDDTLRVYFLPGGMEIYLNGQSVKVTTGPVVARENEHNENNRVYIRNYNNGDSEISIGKWYRGSMEFRNGGSSITVINELPLEEYLYGVVPREMSSGWPLEALKAQAVAARTYTVANYSKRVVEGFNMLDTPTDQAYGGYNYEGAGSTRAVVETAGIIILYGGKPISAVYHSTSGGHTEDNENVWNGEPCPYLRGKEDPFSTENGLANWAFNTTVEEVRDTLLANGGDIGPIDKIQLEKYESGRVRSVIITDINGNTIKKSGSEFGKFFNPNFYTYITPTDFMSNYFDVDLSNVLNPSFIVLNGSGKKEPVDGNSLYGTSEDGNTVTLNGKEPAFHVLSGYGSSSHQKAASGRIVFEGHGWGHGVGMSQWGAYGMAVKGKNYRDILNFYYTGVEVTADY
ncbi:MAG: hypothetical protein CVU89_11440 [Firmicutes bacterium HGW-Firmicutes-14]|nr:MAG: hypothetical protein CVU89_11440 [Firmicutes bacterium HGW-Firmicutes-14]